MIKESDYAGNGQINFSEFLAATLDIKKFISETKLRSVFSMFNTDGSGTITEQNLLFAFQKLGQNLDKKDIKHLI